MQVNRLSYKEAASCVRGSLRCSCSPAGQVCSSSSNCYMDPPGQTHSTRQSLGCIRVWARVNGLGWLEIWCWCSIAPHMNTTLPRRDKSSSLNSCSGSSPALLTSGCPTLHCSDYKKGWQDAAVETEQVAQNRRRDRRQRSGL